MVAFLAQGLMSAPRDIPADMLLLRARASRLTPRPWSADETAIEIFSSEEDALVESDEPIEHDPGSLRLRRPIASVRLGQIEWSGAIDHEALQAALACAPAGPVADPRWRLILGSQQARAWGQAEDSASALEVTLSAADLALCEALAKSNAGRSLPAFAAALQLPDRLAGASAPTGAVLAEVLASYRRASLTCVWASCLELRRAELFARERDESAVALLSAMRAVLGEP